MSSRPVLAHGRQFMWEQLTIVPDGTFDLFMLHYPYTLSQCIWDTLGCIPYIG